MKPRIGIFIFTDALAGGLIHANCKSLIVA